jgi:hypothetical protein
VNLFFGQDADEQVPLKDHSCVPVKISFKADVNLVSSSKVSDPTTSKLRTVRADLL